MFHRSSPLYASFSVGTWFSVQVRISFLFPLVLFVLCYRLGDVQYGLIFGTVLFLSVLVHEMAHVVVAHLTGGSGDEILIWPLGGLAHVRPAPTFASQFQTAAAGPASNLAICLLALPSVWDSGHLSAAMNPFVLPAVDFNHALPQTLFLLAFSANWLLLLVNLIPAYPLDGGKMLRSALSTRAVHEVADELYLRIGFIIAIAIMLGGLLFGGQADAAIVLIGAVILALNMHESMQLQQGNYQEDRLLDMYDFSHGYTSLEQSAQPAAQPQPGMIQRWIQRRRKAKQLRLQQQAEAEDREADRILEKVHQTGIESLTTAEREILHKISMRYRSRTNPPT